MCFTEKKTSLIIAFDIKQRELFLQGIKKYKKEEFVVDNSQYYKKVK